MTVGVTCIDSQPRPIARPEPTLAGGAASVSRMVDGVDDDEDMERLVGTEVEIVPGRPTVVSALPLRTAARQRLSQLLDARVIDVREPCDEPDLVLAPSSSPQLIGALKRQYGDARIVVVELDDTDLDIELSGPVRRLLDSGADAYVLADSLEDLAGKIRSGRPGTDTAGSGEADEIERSAMRELPSGTTVEDLVAVFLRDSVERGSSSEAATIDRQAERSPRPDDG